MTNQLELTMKGSCFHLVRRRALAIVVPIMLQTAAACSGDPAAPEGNRELSIRAGKATNTSITVTKASPDSATQDTTLDVVITGSGFVSGAAVEWQLGGSADPAQVRTNSTRYVSSRQLVANVTISTTATLGEWDIAVSAGGKGGIGTEAFTIRQKATLSECGGQIELADSRVSLDWASLGTLASASGLSNDGLGSYSGGTQSVHAKIFYHDRVCSGSGDMVFDPDKNGGQLSRKLVVSFPAGNALGLPSSGIAIGPFLNFASIMQLGSDVTWDAANPTGRDATFESKYPGSPRSLEIPATTVVRPGYPSYPIAHPNLHVAVGVPGCEWLDYDQIRMTRTGVLSSFEQLVGARAADGAPLGRWQATRDGVWVVESVDTGTGYWHAAQCFVTKKGALVANGVPMNMPFRVVVSELP